MSAQRREYVFETDEARVADPAEWFGQLRFIAEERGYNPGWVSHQFREKFGHWPNGYRTVPPTPPTPEVRNWVKARLIKRRAANG